MNKERKLSLGRDVEMSQDGREQFAVKRLLRSSLTGSCLGLRYIQEPILVQPRPGLAEIFLENTAGDKNCPGLGTKQKIDCRRIGGERSW